MEPIGDPAADDDYDFADEHQDVTVDPEVTAGEADEEPESPDGWDGLDRNTAP
jgi:hypothetical protein